MLSVSKLLANSETTKYLNQTSTLKSRICTYTRIFMHTSYTDFCAWQLNQFIYNLYHHQLDDYWMMWVNPLLYSTFLFCIDHSTAFRLDHFVIHTTTDQVGQMLNYILKDHTALLVSLIRHSQLRRELFLCMQGQCPCSDLYIFVHIFLTKTRLWTYGFNEILIHTFGQYFAILPWNANRFTGL